MPGILAKELAFDFLCGGEPAHGSNRLHALTAGTLAHRIVAIAAVKQLVLMTSQEVAGVIRVSRQRIETGPSGEITEHIRKIAQVTIGQSAGCHRSFWIKV